MWIVMASKRKPDEVPTKKKYKTGAEKRGEATRKGLAEAGSAPGQQKLWPPKLVTLPSCLEAASDQVLVDEGTSVCSNDEAGTSTMNVITQETTEEMATEDIELIIHSGSESSDCVDPDDPSSTICFGFQAPEPSSAMPTKLHFMKAHPIQPVQDATHPLPFHPHKAYFRAMPDGSAIQRKWLSYCVKTQKMFCSICMAFCSVRKSLFITGWKVDKLHVYNRIKEHEDSGLHQASVTAYLSASKGGDIETLINVDSVNRRKEKILENRTVVKRLIEITLCIAKLGIAYRGKHEAAYTLLNEDVNHGNFLEMALLVSKCDSTLNKHIKEVAALSEKRKRATQSKGRGGLVTLLSKTSINSLILIMRDMVKQKISQEVKEAVKFSVEMDSTQDVSVKEQCCIILRYVKDRNVYERLFSLVDLTSTTGDQLFSCLKEQLENSSLSVSNIVGCSFDGAANLSGCYNGVQARIKSISCNCVYTWCYAHILNLVMVNVTQCVSCVKSFFGLLEMTAVFFTDSYKRSAVWTQQVSSHHGHEKLARLKKISNTRWWSKPRALSTLFSSLADQTKELYSTMLVCLEHISTSVHFDKNAINDARSLLHSWTRYETLLVAFLFMQIFEIVSPVSDYLQTLGLDILQAWRMVDSARSRISLIRSSFENLTHTVNSFILKTNEALDEQDVEVTIETSLPQKRVGRKKRMPGELAADEPSTDPLIHFKTNVFYMVLDRATSSIDDKFSKNKSLIYDLSFLDPKQFHNLKSSDVPPERLKTVAQLADVDVLQLKVELLNFKEIYPRLKSPSPAASVCEVLDAEEGDIGDVENVACENCFTCCYRLLYDYNLHAAAFTNLFAVYKTLLTLACTQVSCERVFSKLKIVKNRLRSLIGQEILESLILLNVERDLARDLIYDDIIDKFASTSSVLQRMLF